jgi:hypothetical protein
MSIDNFYYGESSATLRTRLSRVPLPLQTFAIYLTNDEQKIHLQKLARGPLPILFAKKTSLIFIMRTSLSVNYALTQMPRCCLINLRLIRKLTGKNDIFYRTEKYFTFLFTAESRYNVFSKTNRTGTFFKKYQQKCRLQKPCRTGIGTKNQKMFKKWLQTGLLPVF